MADITLSAGVRQNLLSLQNTADLMGKTQNRLATGKKVNSALDNPTNFFTSSALQSRASDMSALLDSMSNGIKTLQAADNGLTSISKTIESMQSTLRQARQDKTFKSEAYTLNLPNPPAGTEVLSFTGGAFGTASESIALTTGTPGTPADAGQLSFTFGSQLSFDDAADALTFDIAVDGGAPTAVTINAATLTAAGIAGGTIDNAAELRTALGQALTTAGVTGVTVGGTGNAVTLTSGTTGAASAVAITGTTATNAGGANTLTNTSGIANASDTGTAAAPATTVARTVDELVTAINSDADLKGKIRASNDNGRLRIENISTQRLDVSGLDATTGTVTGGVGTAEIGGNAVRANLVKQFNELRDQLDKLADDASYNGINLLRGDLLKLTFNETGTSTIDIQAKDLNDQERPINTTTLGLTFAVEPDFDSDASLDDRMNQLTQALGVIRSQSSSFGSNLSIVENRTAFTKAMINTLQTGADSLVLADTNEEAANMLALQTRQQLSSTALSLASQADQAVLKLF